MAGNCTPASEARKNEREQHIWDAMKAVAPSVTQLCLTVQPSMIPGGAPQVQINPEMVGNLSYILAHAMWTRLCQGGDPTTPQPAPTNGILGAK